MTNKANREHLFWARELVRLSREQAAKKGVPDHVMAQAMLVQSFMLFTGQPERDAAKAVSALYTTSMAKHVNAKPAGSNAKPAG
jgi:hypothetical protein